MKALDYLHRYVEMKRTISSLVARIAIEEQLAWRHDEPELKKEALKMAEELKREAIALKEEQEKMEKTIWAMPADRARVLRLHYFDGESLRTIARDMNRKIEFVEGLHEEGMRNLQRILDVRENPKTEEAFASKGK